MQSEVLPVVSVSSVGALRLAYPSWQKLVRNDWILRVVREGFRFRFVSEPPLSDTPIAFPPPTDPARFTILQKEVESLVAKGAVTLVNSAGPGFYSRLFTVPKKSGDFRPVLDPHNSQSLLIQAFCPCQRGGGYRRKNNNDIKLSAPL